MPESSPQYVLTLSCADRPGIVHAVAGRLAGAGCNIQESQQFGDPFTGRFFMRVHISGPAGSGVAALREEFAATAAEFGMEWAVHDLAVRPRVLILVSKQGHCLNDLLFRRETGALKIDVPAIVSNHPDFAALARWHNVPFHHLPVTPDTKPEQEEKLRALVEEQRIDLVVLARYMQVLSDDLCRHLAGRAINIHHSFLPSFKGARPYHQAHARGVKLIGATAHYVTGALDEGPIIEQEVARVDHTDSPDEMVAVGRDVECLALSRAVRWHAEHRVLLNGDRTVVFD
ncbi:formyltetrahydrofolate deformylase [Cryptosporangium arvum]|uniref:formyltetrahydrofolate deformylase n=1 Tax=Cryptosporangium arvum TaxID=80871 RepID=UPI0004B4C9E0|nr:formyltetrahydrofolate deformylase [Cryptosporangium arvum]